MSYATCWRCGAQLAEPKPGSKIECPSCRAQLRLKRRLNLIAGPPTFPKDSPSALVPLCAVGALVLLLYAFYLVALRGLTLTTVIALGGLVSIIAALYASAWPYFMNPPPKRPAPAPTVWVAPYWQVAEKEGRFDEASRVYEAHLQRGYREDIAKRQAQLCVLLGRLQEAVRKYERLAVYYESKLQAEPRKASAIYRMILRLDPQNHRARKWTDPARQQEILRTRLIAQAEARAADLALEQARDPETAALASALPPFFRRSTDEGPKG